MRRILRVVLPVVVIAVVLVGCAREARVIPVRKMERIYREMFLADQWLADNPERRVAADTTWFYEPLFEKYGFTLKDYQKSVDHYLNDPERYAEMLGRVMNGLLREKKILDGKIASRDRELFVSDSIAKARVRLPLKDFHYILDVFNGRFAADSICFKKDSIGTYRLVPVVKDTMFLGPELILCDTATVSRDSTAEANVAGQVRERPKVVLETPVRIVEDRVLSKEILPQERILD